MANTRPTDQELTKGEIARERLLEAGERLFSVRSLDEVSIDDISNKAGVAHGLLFHYFKSKNAFYAEVQRRAAVRVETMHREPRLEKSADEKLFVSLSRHIDFIMSRPAAFKFHARGGGVSAEVRQIWEDSRRRFILMALNDFYGIERPSAHLVSAIRAWLGFFDELVLAWIQDPAIKRGGLLALCVQLFNEVLRHSSLLDDEASSTPAPRKSSASKRLRIL